MKTDIQVQDGTLSRHWLPLKHLMERLNKGPFKIYRAQMFGSSVFLEPRGSTQTLSFNTRIRGNILYEHSTEKVALAIERSFRKQIENTRRILNRPVNRRR